MFSRGQLFAGLISGGLSQVHDIKTYAAGSISDNGLAARTTKNITSALGLMTGLEYGAGVGSAVLPGIGTAIGSILGAIVGSRLGNSIGLEVGNSLFLKN